MPRADRVRQRALSQRKPRNDEPGFRSHEECQEYVRKLWAERESVKGWHTPEEAVTIEKPYGGGEFF